MEEAVEKESAFEPLYELSSYLSTFGFGELLSREFARAVLLLGLFLLALVVAKLVKSFVLSGLHKLASRSRVKWDDIFLEQPGFKGVIHFASALVVYAGASFVFPDISAGATCLRRLSLAVMVYVFARMIAAFVDGLHAIYEKSGSARNKPIKAFVQLGKIVLYFISSIFVVAVLLDKSPWMLVSGLGAMTAIILLVFKDSILGFVASIQIQANDMVRPGDWIEMPKYGADGDVIEVSLNTIKVRNWDKTITTIPTYSLVSDSFKNWRGMATAGGRRIKRAIYVDMTSVVFCDEEQLKDLSRVQLLSAFLESRSKEMAEFNRDIGADVSHPVNGRKFTNLGLFRTYLLHYLRSLHWVNKDMTLLVRHLSPGAEGIPIEVYLFSSDKRWDSYESYQADVFDHILAVLPHFGLRVYQQPSWYDMRCMSVPRGSS